MTILQIIKQSFLEALAKFTFKPDSTIEPPKPPKQEPSLPHSESYVMPGSLEWYDELFKSAVLRPEFQKEIEWTFVHATANKDRYLWIQKETGVPWMLIAAIHKMEADFNFNTFLHNGDPLFDAQGRPVKTVHVPKGRGPFFTWENSVIDALHYDGLISSEPWSVPLMLQMAEKYNGLGYLKFHQETKSPYLWSGTNHYTRGKYVEDGKFDPKAVSERCGVAALFIRLKMADML